jgi:branched-chain amino acid transport system permease protein
MLLAATILIDGFVYAAWLFIVAVGLTLVFGVMKILNVAHGQFYSIGAYATASLVGLWFVKGYAPAASYLVMLLAALAAGLIVGFVLERVVLRVIYGRDEVIGALATYAVFLILEDTVRLSFGTGAYLASQPRELMGTSELGELTIANYDLFLVLVAILVGVLFWLGLNRTRVGKLLLAVIHDREMAQAFGVNVNKLFTITFVIGGILGALGGALTSPILSVSPGIGVEVIVLAFAVVVIGGMGSVVGALIGALIVGIARAMAVHLAPNLELFVIYAVMTAVLAIRPFGLFARGEARKI